MTQLPPAIQLTERFTQAVDYARVQHAQQTRKGTTIPYLYHLLGVASLVLRWGGDEDQAIAGLLHDVVEDCGAAHLGVVRERFGDRIAGIVADCTDGTEESKAAATTPEAKRADWRARKLHYLEHLQRASDDTLLVSCCDKLHNARAIVLDAEDPRVGSTVFDRFTAGRDGTLRYYQSLAAIFTARHVAPARVLDQLVARMHALAGATERHGLTA